MEPILLTEVIDKLNQLINKRDIKECYPILKTYARDFDRYFRFTDIIQSICNLSENLINEIEVLDFLYTTDIIEIEYVSNKFCIVFIINEREYNIYFNKLTLNYDHDILEIIFDCIESTKRDNPACKPLYDKIMNYRKKYSLCIDYNTH